MLSREDSVRLRHMLDAAIEATVFVEGKDRASLNNERVLALALLKLLEIVGEAARNVSDQLRQSSPQIPWKQITGTRDRLAHGYFDVDLDIIWAIVTNDLPPLIVELKNLTASHETR